MKKIEQILEEKNVELASLPKKIQDAIQNSIKHYAEWEESESALTDESTPEDRNSVADLKASVQEFNNSIAEVIDDLMNEEEEKQEPTPHPTPNAQEPVPVPAPVPVPPSASDKEEKKGMGVGVFILGAAVLLLTAGAVNMMNKK
jgi:hypothetical protein